MYLFIQKKKEGKEKKKGKGKKGKKERKRRKESTIIGLGLYLDLITQPLVVFKQSLDPFTTESHGAWKSP